MRRLLSALHALTGAVIVTMLTVGTASADTVGLAPSLAMPLGTQATTSACPWLTPGTTANQAPATLANEVLNRMTLGQKIGLVILHTAPPLENVTGAMPGLCIPPLSLTDGTSGLSSGLPSVTAFPAALGLGATFNPALAFNYGVAVADEAKAKGIFGLQSPDLNIARVALDGRNFETFGEDPTVISTFGVQEIRGIQSQGVMAVAKHLGLYTQETARARLQQFVSTRALQEIYLAPFKAAVTQAHVAGIMCAYGRINGVLTCADPALYAELRAWGFSGFVRSDLLAVRSPARAFAAGMDLIKPESASTLRHLVQTRVLPLSDLERADRVILTTLFRYHDVTSTEQLHVNAVATSATSATLAANIAEQSIVLLKNNGLLPLSPTSSLAVIGTDAQTAPIVSGGGSSLVVTPSVSTPLTALRASASPSDSVAFAPGEPLLTNLHHLNGIAVTRGTPLALVSALHHHHPRHEPGTGDIRIDYGANVDNAIATATKPGTNEGWNSWQIDVRAKESGPYEIAFQSIGDSWVFLNGRAVLSSPGLHVRTINTALVNLRAGRSYNLRATWFAVQGHPAPEFGIVDVKQDIARAVALAKKMRVAVVFAGTYDQEGADLNTLQLPGDQNALIEAVARVNPRTIVVLNTGGPVAMPWLSAVNSVLEAWYPGQADGVAIANVLRGVYDPSGHLPITFPASRSETPTSAIATFPGHDAAVTFTDPLAVGYRWYQSTGVTPLFPFGYGLSYTKFSLTGASATVVGATIHVRTTVTNVGPYRGTFLTQLYIQDPASANEPGAPLRGFAQVTLNPGQSIGTSLTVPIDTLKIFSGGRDTLIPGQYQLLLGTDALHTPLHLTVTLS